MYLGRIVSNTRSFIIPAVRTRTRTSIPAFVAKNNMKLSLLSVSSMISCTAYSTAAFTFTPNSASPSSSSSSSSSSAAATRRSMSTSSTPSSHTTTYGEGMDQNTMMESDYLIPVDKHDNPLIHESISKRKAHEFNPSQPRGIAHRAFSVFLFNPKNELLLTQRASTKITFPNVWTNTCCSHPLKDMVPDEVDTNNDYPHFPGITNAAIRKLRHELGIVGLPSQDFTFLTRFHYWAADTVTYGQEDTPWGEHEIDYILFIKCNDGEPKLDVDKEEVSDYEYVSVDRLKECMYDKSKMLRSHNDNEGAGAGAGAGAGEMLFSPWFRGIMENGGFDWMEDLDGALGGKYCNDHIYYFDPPPEHYATYNLDSHTKDTGVLKATAAAAATATNKHAVMN